MIYEDYERGQWREYTADVLGIIGTTLLALGGQDAKLPLFTEIIYPETADEPPQQTAEDAKAHVYAMFGITPEMLKGEGVTE